MLYIIFFCLFLGLAITPTAFFGPLRPFHLIARSVAVVAALFCIAETSVVRIGGNEVGIARKIYGSTNLGEGHLIAADGENGYQADIIAPGTFRISPFYNVLNDVTVVPIVVVPQGFYGRIVAQDGVPLEPGQIMASEWPDKDVQNFLDAKYFLHHGGRRGLQASVLKPGAYPLNTALFNTRIGFERNGKDQTAADDIEYDRNGLHHQSTPLTTAITRVPAGFVGVVRSTITEPGATCSEVRATTDANVLVAHLVPRGCQGVWAESLPPGDYYLNRDAYDVTLVDTRVQTLEFKGGYAKRSIDLKIDSKGDFSQTERTEPRPKPADAADTAVFTKVEGWEVPQELRVVMQVQPQHAPLVVAAVGGLDALETRIIVPSIRSQVRNVFGGTFPHTDAARNNVISPTKVVDLVERRPELEAAIAERVQEDGRRAGVDVKEIRLGDSAIPPELLLAYQREQLAGQIKRALEQEQKTQVQRQQTERERASADRQGDIVQAEIEVRKAELSEKRRAAEGRAERVFLEEQATGQRAQANVLGQDNVLKLQALQQVLEMLGKNPQMLSGINLPSTLVVGPGNGLEGPAAILGGLLAPRPQPVPASEPPTQTLTTPAPISR